MIEVKEYTYFKSLAEFEEFLVQNDIPALPESETENFHPITKIHRYCYQGICLTISFFKVMESITFTISSAFSEYRQMLLHIGLVSPARMRAYKDKENIIIELNYEAKCSQEIRIPMKKRAEEESDNR